MVLEKLLNLGRKIIPRPIFTFFQPVYHSLLSFWAVFWYRWPAKKLKVIGVTGTNGKSSVVFLISQILEQAGYSVAAISSIEFKIKNKVWANDLKMTMPGRLQLQRFLHQAVKAGCQYAVLEITSEGIKQHRHRFIGFDSAVLTNITPEHLESHGGFEAYKKAKAKLFQAVKPQGEMIINLDDPQADYFLQFPANHKWTYTIDNQEKDLRSIKALSFKTSSTGISFKIKQTQFNLNLLGKFNGYNALAAITLVLTQDIPLVKIKSALEQVEGIPGRLEIVLKKPLVMVDYAHTPDALENVYQTVKELSAGQIIGILGAAGGGRDKRKRAQLGQLAEQYLDQVIITNEDPYDEDPQAIINQVAQGLEKKKPIKILDRRKAINFALKKAQADDLVIITGKGCEPWMCLADDKKIPWDDRAVVREEATKARC
jgi:UDP-N-acetylmuramoyl-L-alanyl-D-glutamate--2,6-diaminopimelate ligase